MKNVAIRWIVFVAGLLLVAAVAAIAVKDSRPDDLGVHVTNYTAWDKETLDAAADIPVQEDGRIKPIGTYAGFTMLSLHGARSMEVLGQGDQKILIKPLDWLMDCLFRPDFARQLPTFLVEDSNVITAIGVTAKARRDRYSYNELEAGVPKLKQLADSYRQIASRDPKLLKPIEQQTMNLSDNVQQFELLTGYMRPFRDGLLPSSPGRPVLNVSDTLGKATDIRQELQHASSENREPRKEAVYAAQLIIDAANDAIGPLLFFPPPTADDLKWLSAGNRVYNLLEGTTREPEKSIADIKALEELSRSAGNQAEFRAKLIAFKTDIVERAAVRGEGKSVSLEASYFRKNWFIYSLVWFLMAVVTACVMFFTGTSKAGQISMWATAVLTFAGLVYLIIPIAKRSIIMQRPPVGNLYDTIIFIAMAFVVFALIIEALTRKRFALALAPIAGALLIVLARKFEVGEGKDHLSPLNAVLRSNYWLTIHVITITLGYAAGLITAMMSIIYVLQRALGIDDQSGRRALTRAVYGCVCLTVLLSLVGTVLGGIWANDSWGRFWGWDPKENGALMIVLWNLAILHGRAGGYIKEWGLHLASVFGAIVIGFSWWHVNFLGVGLHNYGFAADKKFGVFLFYGIILFILLVGGATAIFERIAKARRKVEREEQKALVQATSGGR